RRSLEPRGEARCSQVDAELVLEQLHDLAGPGRAAVLLSRAQERRLDESGELERDAELPSQLRREAQVLDGQVQREADVVGAVEDHLALGLVDERVARA